MKGKGVLIVSLILNAAFLGLLLTVNNATKEEAKAKVEAFKDLRDADIKAVKKIKTRFNTTWNFVLEAFQTDGSFETVKKLAEGTKFPALKEGGEETAMTVNAVDGKELTVGWDNYTAKLTFEKGVLKSLDASGLKTVKDAFTKDKETGTWNVSK